MLAGVLMSVDPHVSCAFLHRKKSSKGMVPLIRPSPACLKRNPRLVSLSRFAGNVHEGPANR